MANYFKTVFDIDGSSWDRFYRRVNSNIRTLTERTPGQLMGGILGGAGLAAGAFAARAFVRAPQDIMDAHRAAQLSEGRLQEGPLWDLMLKERKQQLPGVLSGAASNVASIMHSAERFDPQAIEARERFLGGETQNVAEAMRFAVNKYEQANGVIQEEMRQILPFLKNEKARAQAIELLSDFDNIAKLQDMQNAANIALRGHTFVKGVEEGVVGTVARGVGNVYGAFQTSQPGNLPPDIFGGGGFGPGNPQYEELMQLQRQQTDNTKTIAEEVRQ